MRTFAESNKKKKGGEKGKAAKEKVPAPLQSEGEDDAPGGGGPLTPRSVEEARKRKFGGGKPATPKSGKKGFAAEKEEQEEEPKKEFKT